MWISINSSGSWNVLAAPSTLEGPINYRAQPRTTALTENGKGIGLYREISIAIQKESGDSNGGNV